MTTAKPTNLADHLLRIRSAALQAADPAAGVRKSLRLEETADGRQLLHAGAVSWDMLNVHRVLVIAVGKAAASMAEAAVHSLGDRLTGGIVVTKTGHATGRRLPDSLQVHEAGHPTPDHCGLQAAGNVLNLLENATLQDRVVVLLSGGASALLPLSPPGVSLEDLQTLTSMLLRAGASINELNTVRKHLDQLKGGGMARAAAPAPLSTLILSDVVGDPLDVIASGPAVPDPTSYADAWGVLERCKLLQALPPAVRVHLQRGLSGDLPDTPKPGDPIFEHVSSTVIGSNRQSALAAREEAEKLGYNSLLVSTFVEGEAREVGKLAAALAQGISTYGDPLPPPACLVLGGETTVTVRGMGRGGRNTELALSAAIALKGLPEAAIMALATDGTDGPTDSAGAIVTRETVPSAARDGLDPFQALNNNDSYTYLDAAGALMRTGPTGTNVNDLLVILVSRPQD